MPTIKILGHDYQLIFDEDKIRANNSSAEVWPHKTRITIDPSTSLSVQQEGLLHEILEALNYHLKLNLDHDRQLIPLSEALLCIIKDNEKFFKLPIDPWQAVKEKL